MLHELQARMAAALLSGDTDALGDAIAGDAARLRIHHNNLFSSLTEALATHFPVVKRLVGDGFFAYTAHQFIATHPPSVPCLAVFGDALPGFLDAFAPARSLPYLVDVARLEWAVMTALNAAPGAGIGLDSLRSVAREEFGGLRLILDPTLGFLTSPWPIDAIWRANQPEGDGTVDVDPSAGARFVQVERVADEQVAMTALDEAVWRFRHALEAGQTLGDAAGAALAADPLFDLAPAIHHLFADRLVVALSLPPHTSTQGEP